MAARRPLVVSLDANRTAGAALERDRHAARRRRSRGMRSPMCASAARSGAASGPSTLHRARCDHAARIAASRAARARRPLRDEVVEALRRRDEPAAAGGVRALARAAACSATPASGSLGRAPRGARARAGPTSTTRPLLAKRRVARDGLHPLTTARPCAVAAGTMKPPGHMQNENTPTPPALLDEAIRRRAERRVPRELRRTAVRSMSACGCSTRTPIANGLGSSRDAGIAQPALHVARGVAGAPAPPRAHRARRRPPSTTPRDAAASSTRAATRAPKRTSTPALLEVLAQRRRSRAAACSCRCAGARRRSISSRRAVAHERLAARRARRRACSRACTACRR